MSKRRIKKRNKIKRTSSYRGYNRFSSYRRYNSSNSSSSESRSLGKAVAMAVAVVAVASLVIFSCIKIIPILVDFSQKNFIQPTSSEYSEAISKIENSKIEASKNENSKVKSKPKENNGYDDNGVFIYKNKGYKLFKGSDETALKYAEIINEVAATLDESINVYSMIVPTHSSVALEELQKKNTDSEIDNINKIKNTLSDDITFIDVKDALKKKKEKYIYYSTDENWTSLGAYYAYQQYCKIADFNAISMDNAEKKKIEKFSGNLILNTKSDKNKNGNPNLLKNLDTVEYYTFENYDCKLWKTASSGEVTVPFINEAVSAENALDIFSYGNVSLFKIYTNKNTGKNLCIVKDSYGSEIAPYFTENYDEVHVIDSRYFEGSLTGYCYNHNITDVLFINGINNANTNDYADAISALSKEN